MQTLTSQLVKKNWSQKRIFCHLVSFVLVAEALGNMDWFFLLNEEKQYEKHMVLGDADDNQLHWSTRDVEFPSISPVQTMDGIYSARFVNLACLVVLNMHSCNFQGTIFVVWSEMYGRKPPASFEKYV